MTIFVQAKSLSVTAALRQFVQEQASKIAKISGSVSQVSVYLEKTAKKKANDPALATVKYLVRLPGRSIVIKQSAADMYDAVMSATDRAVRQVRKLKEKQADRRFAIAN